MIMFSAFYPTYEELKSVNGNEIIRIPLTFYPTYEELKLIKNGLVPVIFAAFYPTYEELKSLSAAFSLARAALFILPMRN